MIQLTLKETDEPVWVNPHHVVMVGTAYVMIPPTIQGAKPTGKKAGTLIACVGTQPFSVKEEPAEVALLIARGKFGLA